MSKRSRVMLLAQCTNTQTNQTHAATAATAQSLANVGWLVVIFVIVVLCARYLSHFSIPYFAFVWGDKHNELRLKSVFATNLFICLLLSSSLPLSLLHRFPLYRSPVKFFGQWFNLILFSVFFFVGVFISLFSLSLFWLRFFYARLPSRANECAVCFVCVFLGESKDKWWQ